MKKITKGELDAHRKEMIREAESSARMIGYMMCGATITLTVLLVWAL